MTFFIILGGIFLYFLVLSLCIVMFRKLGELEAFYESSTIVIYMILMFIPFVNTFLLVYSITSLAIYKLDSIDVNDFAKDFLKSKKQKEDEAVELKKEKIRRGREL